MREIKFRAWEESEKRMYADIQKGIWEDPDDWLYFGDTLGLERFKVMQYTGLKDKNGREIYEGDILNRIVTVKVFGLDLPPEDVEDTVAVEWRDDYAGFYVGERPLFAEVGATYCSSTGCRCTEFEIIGNIHEDPELLEVAE